MLQEAFGDNAMSQSKAFLWYKHFKDGQTSVDDDEHSGRPSISTTPENIAKVCEGILADCRQTIHDVCEIVGLSYGTVQRILVDSLNTRRISARFVPRLLSDDQKALSISVCRELRQQARDDPNFISNVITSDETWVYGYDPEAKQQSSQWKSSNSLRPKKARQVRSNVKSMLNVFFGIQGIVHQEFIPPGQTVNGKFYCEFLKWLRSGIRRKCQDKWKKNNWFLHHDSAPAHTSLVQQFLTSKNITMIPPPICLTSPLVTFSYSPRWNYGWKGVILTRLRRSMQKRKRLSRESHLRTSRDAWNHGKHAGITVYMPKGTTLKETVETRSYGKLFFLWSNSPNFWVAPCIVAYNLVK